MAAGFGIDNKTNNKQHHSSSGSQAAKKDGVIGSHTKKKLFVNQEGAQDKSEFGMSKKPHRSNTSNLKYAINIDDDFHQIVTHYALERKQTKKMQQKSGEGKAYDDSSDSSLDIQRDAPLPHGRSMQFSLQGDKDTRKILNSSNERVIAAGYSSGAHN